MNNYDLICPVCQSPNIVFSTDEELEKFHLIEFDCRDCGHTWLAGKSILKEIQGKNLEDIR